MDTRESNLDLLRIIATFLVVMLHVCVRPIAVNIEQPSINFSIINLYDCLTRIAVPIFVLLSGAFLLSNKKNKSYLFFYKKTLCKIILPTFIASFVYLYYSLLLNIIQGLIFPSKQVENLNVNPLCILWNPSFYHLWYMYMLIGLYLSVPLLIRLKEYIGKKKFMYVGIMFLLLDSILIYYNEKIWPIRFINYLGYFILGDSLHYLHIKKSSIYLKITFCCYLFNVIGTEFIVRKGYFSNINQKLILYGNLSPFIILESITLFIYFTGLTSKNSKLLLLTPHTFNIYLVHAGILMPLDQLINNILKLHIPLIIYIPLLSIIVFILSYIASRMIKTFTTKIRQSFFVRLRTLCLHKR